MDQTYQNTFIYPPLNIVGVLMTHYSRMAQTTALRAESLSATINFQISVVAWVFRVDSLTRLSNVFGGRSSLIEFGVPLLGALGRCDGYSPHLTTSTRL